MSKLKSKKIVTAFSIASLLAGFLFLKPGMILLGNVVSEAKPSFNITALIGMLLVMCSIILAGYAIKKD